MTHLRPAKMTWGASRREGFTLVELAVVVMVIALLAAIAIPNLQRVLLKARATEAVSELYVMRVAVLSYLGDNHTWPEDVTRGLIPPELIPYLPSGFSFTPPEYILDYDNWSAKPWLAGPGFLGLTVITQDPELGAAMMDILGPNTWTNGSDKFTWIMLWTD